MNTISSGLILSEPEANELLGVQTPAIESGPALNVSVDVGILNALGVRWVNAADLERALLAFADQEPIERVAQTYRELADIVVGKV